MIQGKYSVSLKTPMGLKKGVITLDVKGNSLSGSLEVFGKVNTFENGIVNGNNIKFSGVLQIPFGKIPYEVEGTIDGNKVKAIVKTAKSTMEAIGERV